MSISVGSNVTNRVSNFLYRSIRACVLVVFVLGSGLGRFSQASESIQKIQNPATDGASQGSGAEIAQSDEIVVLAPRAKGSVSELLEYRKNSNQVSEVMGSEQMARQGDSDAAASLRRVTGLTLMDGKFVYIRGLSDRYSGAILNGTGLPSPEPGRRVVPLDLFPSSLLESVQVQKSYSADLPAEFGGGLIQMKTKSIPTKPFVKASVAAEVIQSESGSVSDTSDRQMPGFLNSGLRSGRRILENTPPVVIDGFSKEEIQRMGQELPENYGVSKYEGSSIPNLLVTAGSVYDPGPWRTGGSFSLIRNQDHNYRQIKSRKFNVGSSNQLVLDENAQIQKSESEIKTGLGVDYGLEILKSHKLQFGYLFVRHTQDQVQEKSAELSSDSVKARQITNLDWVQRDLSVSTFRGEHEFQDWKLEYRLSKAKARRDAPDAKEYVYVKRDQDFELNTDTTGNRRVYSELEDSMIEGAVDLSYEGRIESFGNLKIKSGLFSQNKERNSDVYRLHYKYKFAQGAGPDLRKKPNELFRDDQIGPDEWSLTNLTESADSYNGILKNQAAYLMGQVELSSKWVFELGLRDENFNQEVRTYYYYNPNDPTSFSGLKSRHLVPSYLLLYKPDEAWRHRMGYSETLSRPEFRELSTVPFIDDESGYEAVGNSQLKECIIQNWDLRSEFYFNPDEFVSVGLFLKNFRDPIEDVFEPSPNLRKTYVNTQRAVNRGFEIEARFGLRRLTRELRRWSFASNISLIESKVEIDQSEKSIQTSDIRPLQGQSPYVVNMQLAYDRPLIGIQSTLLYNVIGPRITEVGTNARPDVYEEPFHQLDWTLSQKIGKNVSFGAKIKNLLNPEAQSRQGDEVVKTSRKGISGSVQFSMAL